MCNRSYKSEENLEPKCILSSDSKVLSNLGLTKDNSFITQAECIYHDQISDLMLRRPNRWPDRSWTTRPLLGDQIASGDQIGDQICDQIADSCAFWANIRPFLKIKTHYSSYLTTKSFGRDLIDNLIFTFWSRWKSGHQSGQLERSGHPLGRLSIRSPIWSW